MGRIGHECKQSCKQAHVADKRLSMAESSVRAAQFRHHLEITRCEARGRPPLLTIAEEPLC
jgi:hypothetical protein